MGRYFKLGRVECACFMVLCDADFKGNTDVAVTAAVKALYEYPGDKKKTDSPSSSTSETRYCDALHSEHR